MPVDRAASGLLIDSLAARQAINRNGGDREEEAEDGDGAAGTEEVAEEDAEEQEA